MIGVIGAEGDLGSQLRTRIEKSGLKVATYDIAGGAINTHVSAEEVIEQSEITHWCAPPADAIGISAVHEVVLQTSVMGLSRQAKGKWSRGLA
ncbi:hypothetical protein IPL68_07095 [Candidatus Saccharibacteria bacterium]|nr:MAG: hypothetical protein IPL68_07095 [Candidatus Saccharibacteria bacterium]